MPKHDEHKARLAGDWAKIFPTKKTPLEAVAKKPLPAKKTAVKPPREQRAGVMEKLKGLSLRQPWAEEVMRGNKTVEFRQTPVKHRGRIYIYASLGQYSPEEEAEYQAEVGYEIGDLPRGVVVGTVEITDCEEDGDFFAWHLANPKRIAPPVPPVERPQPIWFHPFGKPPIE